LSDRENVGGEEERRKEREREKKEKVSKFTNDHHLSNCAVSDSLKDSFLPSYKTSIVCRFIRTNENKVIYQ